MGFLKRLSSTASAAPRRLRTQTGDPFTGLYGAYMPPQWYGALSAAGIVVTPELSLALSAMYSGVSMIGRDLATLPCQTFKERDDGGKDRVRPRFGSGLDDVGGIGSLAYKLRWQPNYTQTATEFWLGMVVQWLMRSVAYAERVAGPGGFIEQLLPRHPDRVFPERLPVGRLRYRLEGEPSGKPRYLTQDDMYVTRDLSLDGGLTSLSRIQAGAEAIGSALATQRAAAKFFKSGMTAAVIATYTGDMEPEEEDALHRSITRYATGVDNAFGLMLVPDDVKIANLSPTPEKAQMMLAQEWGVREVARLLNLPGSKLGIKDSAGYGSQVQDALNYVGCLRPIGVSFEQSAKRDLILAKDIYSIEFLLAALMRGDFESQANYLDKFIRNRTMRPSEARLILNMNPDARLDELSEGDFRPGATAPPSEKRPAEMRPAASMSRDVLKGSFAMRASAIRVLRRERAAVEKLARKHAGDVDAWQAGLREFYSDHAGFVAETMRVHPTIARAYAAQHGSEFETNGAAVFLGEEATYLAWEQFEADELAALALIEGESVDAWFHHRLVGATK